VQKFRMTVWAVRNVSGLKVWQLRPTEGENSSRIVLFYDRSPNYHAPAGQDIYEGRGGDFWASYGYLDGHAEGLAYKNMDEYIKVFHSPIAQSWYTLDFTRRFSAEYRK
jgi:hypothetical protein